MRAVRVGVGDRLALGAPPPRRRRGRGARRPTSRAAPAPTPTAPPDRTPTPPPPLPQRGLPQRGCVEARTSRRRARPAPQAERRMGRRRERRIERRARRRLRPRQRGGAAAASRGRRPSPARCSQKPPPRRRLQWQGGPQWPRGRERPPPTRRPASLHRQLTKEWGRSRARGRPSHAHPAASRTAPSAHAGLSRGRIRAASGRGGEPGPPPFAAGGQCRTDKNSAARRIRGGPERYGAGESASPPFRERRASGGAAAKLGGMGCRHAFTSAVASGSRRLTRIVAFRIAVGGGLRGGRDARRAAWRPLRAPQGAPAHGVTPFTVYITRCSP